MRTNRIKNKQTHTFFKTKTLVVSAVCLVVSLCLMVPSTLSATRLDVVNNRDVVQAPDAPVAPVIPSDVTGGLLMHTELINTEGAQVHIKDEGDIERTYTYSIKFELDSAPEGYIYDKASFIPDIYVRDDSDKDVVEQNAARSVEAVASEVRSLPCVSEPLEDEQQTKQDETSENDTADKAESSSVDAASAPDSSSERSSASASGSSSSDSLSADSSAASPSAASSSSGTSSAAASEQEPKTNKSLPVSRAAEEDIPLGSSYSTEPAYSSSANTVELMVYLRCGDYAHFPSLPSGITYSVIQHLTDGSDTSDRALHITENQVSGYSGIFEGVIPEGESVALYLPFQNLILTSEEAETHTTGKISITNMLCAQRDYSDDTSLPKFAKDALFPYVIHIDTSDDARTYALKVKDLAGTVLECEVRIADDGTLRAANGTTAGDVDGAHLTEDGVLYLAPDQSATIEGIDAQSTWLASVIDPMHESVKADRASSISCTVSPDIETEKSKAMYPAFNHTLHLTQVEYSVKWEGSSDKDTSPLRVSLSKQAGEDEMDFVEVNAGESTQDAFIELPKYNAGAKSIYSYAIADTPEHVGDYVLESRVDTRDTDTGALKRADIVYKLASNAPADPTKPSDNEPGGVEPTSPTKPNTNTVTKYVRVPTKLPAQNVLAAGTSLAKTGDNPMNAALLITGIVMALVSAVTLAASIVCMRRRKANKTDTASRRA